MRIENARLAIDVEHEYSRRSERFGEATSFQSLLPIMTAPPASFVEVDAKALRETQRLESLQRARDLLQQLVNHLFALLRHDQSPTADPTADFAASCNCRQPLPPEVVALPWTASPPGKRFVVERVAESEKTRVAARGTVHTADGRAIDFRLELGLRRSFVGSAATSAGALKDPLVIHFGGPAAELSDQRFAFDLDADGQVEMLPTFNENSQCGFLALDRDKNGCIDNGRELFGAAGDLAGDGFADLARLDSDGNGWIDEADPAFAELAVWFPGGELKALAATGVGAVSLAAVDSPHTLTDNDNRALGELRQSSVYLREDGTPGWVQQIDLDARELAEAPVVKT